MFEKGFVQPVFASRTSLQRPAPLANETYETEFEEDLSDYEEFSGRRSEDSVSIFMVAYQHDQLTYQYSWASIATPQSHPSMS